jgi:hypothetical protein
MLRLAAIPARGDIAGKLAELIRSGRLRIIECAAAAGGAGGPAEGAGGAASQSTDRARTAAGSRVLSDAALASSAASKKNLSADRNVSKSTVKTWVEIRLVDRAGKPVPNKKYSLQLPDGSERHGSLDESGRARVDQIDPGTCLVSFPEIHAGEWQRLARTADS